MSTPAPVINGKSGAHEQPVSYGTDSSGWFVVRTWHGTLAEIEAQFTACVADGATAEVKGGYGVATLTARYSVPPDGGEGEVPVNTWEFMASHVEKDLLQADIPAVEAISDDNKYGIEYWLSKPEVPDNTVVDATSFFDDGPNSRSNAFAVYKLMLSGMKSVRVNAPVLRHTQTVSNAYAVKAALTSVGKVLSSATLAMLEAIPATVLFNLPADVSKRAGYSYGWMKSHPTIRCAARQRMQIELEYEYGLWPDLIYGAPI